MFLVKWLCTKNKMEYHRFEYTQLLNSLGATTLSSRRKTSDVMLLHGILNNNIKCSSLLDKIYFSAPSRTVRQRSLFYPPRSRINIHKFSVLIRTQHLFNELSKLVDIDIISESSQVIKRKLQSVLR